MTRNPVVRKTLPSGAPVRKSKPGWEVVVPIDLGNYDAPPGVRRLPVPGGWLYQVESAEHDDESGVVLGLVWHPPVFIADMDALFERIARGI